MYPRCMRIFFLLHHLFRLHSFFFLFRFRILNDTFDEMNKTNHIFVGIHGHADTIHKTKLKKKTIWRIKVFGIVAYPQFINHKCPDEYKFSLPNHLNINLRVMDLRFMKIMTVGHGPMLAHDFILNYYCQST